jgi:hypothetical protein
MSLSAPFVFKQMRIVAITQGVDPVVVAETKVMHHWRLPLSIER